MYIKNRVGVKIMATKKGVKTKPVIDDEEDEGEEDDE